MIMSNKKLETSALSPTIQIDYRKHRGVRQTSSGKWGAVILHPVTKVSKWLGSYNTPKEAADAFVKKKMEYQSLALHKTQDFVNSKPGVQGANIQDQITQDSVRHKTCTSAEDYANIQARKMPEFDSARKSHNLSNQTDYRKHKGVRQTKSGKWGAVIRHPISKNSVWLGSYSTPKEAADAFMRTKLEYQSLAMHKGAKIQRPDNYETFLKTCNSAEDYANVSARKMFENDSVVVNVNVKETEDALNMDQAEMICHESEVDVVEDVTAHSYRTTNHPSVDSAEEDGNTDVAIPVNRLRDSGTISRKERGIWGAQISYGNYKVHVGMYSTFEELEAAIHEKRQELDLVAGVKAVAKEPVNGQLKCNQYPEKQVNIIRSYNEEHSAQVVINNDNLDYVADAQVVAEEDRTTTTTEVPPPSPTTTATARNKKSVGSIESTGQIYDTAGQALEAPKRKRGESDLLIDAEKKRKQSIDVDETALPERSDCSSNVDDVKAPCSSSVRNNEFDTCVINAYGQLVGEFSMMDEDLWLMESLNDVDEN